MNRSLSLTPLRLLVVDDCPDSAESLRILGMLWGHQVRTASNGKTALEMAADFEPHVVLLDIAMPGMNGYEVARQLRQMPGTQKVFILAVTGYGRTQDRDQAFESGFDLHLTKPLDPRVLEDFLSKVIVGASSCYGRIV